MPLTPVASVQYQDVPHHLANAWALRMLLQTDQGGLHVPYVPGWVVILLNRLRVSPVLFLALQEQELQLKPQPCSSASPW
jgi:hypothetical protein